MANNTYNALQKRGIESTIAQKIVDEGFTINDLKYKSLKELNHGVTSFISASGISLYPSADSAVYTETSKEVAANFLGEVVVAWEAAADKFKDLGIGVAKIRTGVVFDSSQGAFPKMIQPIKMGVPSVVGDGSQWISWIHTDDIVAIYNHAIDAWPR